MRIHRIQQILDLRSSFCEPPYPGFSLEEACRRKRLTQTKLVRGPNAWVARGSAKSTEEWVERLVRGSLNKVSAANFDEIVLRLQSNTIFSSDETLNLTVSIIFKKALEEPENSKVYAGVCYKLAQYEVSLKSSACVEKGKKFSKLRNAIVGVAQSEFQGRQNVPSVEGLDAEEAEQRRAAFMRRKLANMTFIGELFMHKVLSHNTMMDIIQVIMQVAEKGGYPTCDDIEFLTELFLTVGQSLDAIPELRPKLDSYFKLLERLKDHKEVYPPRIHFKMLNLIELRRDHNWEHRVAAVPRTSAHTHKDPHRLPDKGASRSPITLNTSSVSGGSGGGSAKKGKHLVFPDSAPVSQPPPAHAAGKEATGFLDLSSWRNVVQGTDSAADARDPNVPDMATFKARVRSLLNEWVARRTDECIEKWIDEFNEFRNHFSTEHEISVAVAAEVVREACMTTKVDAQLEGSSFLIVGIFLADKEVFHGFAMALASALDEGILEDVPKFGERFITMLRFITHNDGSADEYHDTACILCNAYSMLHEKDETSIDTLIEEFWKKILPSPKSASPLLPFSVVKSLVAMSNEGGPGLVGRIVASLYNAGLLEEEKVKSWCEDHSEAEGADVIAVFNNAVHH
ncbi:putative eukaryotic translation initiation factor 4 gamma [Trypanosoma vivax]|nr:putative eukaryotic translation initiation factor 4 gamma [Trypanosoma vivax]